MQCVLVGNFGVGNLGDEALKEVFLTQFPEVDWVVLSAHPTANNEVSRLPAGLRSFLSFGWLATLKAYWKCDAVVYGGGTLFTDIESVSACFIWWIHSLPARMFRKPIHLAFQGIGPFKTRVGERLTRSVLRRAATISVRDKSSAKRIEILDKSIKFVQACDPVILLLESQKMSNSTKKLLMLIPRKNSSEKFVKTAQKFVESTDWDGISVISMEPDNPSEKEFVKSLVSKLGQPVSVQSVKTLSDLLQHITSASQVVSERYHGALPALALGVPVEIVSQYEGDKLSSLLHSHPDPEQCQAALALLRTALEIE